MTEPKELKHRDFRGRRRYCRRYRLLSLCSERSLGCFLLGIFLLSMTARSRCLWSVSTLKVNEQTSGPISRSLGEQSLDDDENARDNDRSVQKQRPFISIGRSDLGENNPTNQLLTSRRNGEKRFDKLSLVSVRRSRGTLSSEQNCRISDVRNVSSKIPTPWPINVIQERLKSRRESSSQFAKENEESGAFKKSETSGFSSYPSMGALFFAYAKQQARIGFRQVSEISSQILYHFPPSTPPLILLASIPRNVKLSEGRKAVSGDSFRRIIPMFSDPFARTVVLAGLGLAVVSWSNQELQRKRKLTPLALSALSDEYGVKGSGRVSRVFLPPFLPEVVSEPEIDALLGKKVEESNLGDTQTDDLGADGFEENILSKVSPKIRRHLNGIYETTTTTSRRFFRNYYSDWLQGRAVRKREVAKIRRNRIFDELVALQALKKRQTSSRNKSETKTSVEPELGYALVTGASRGIGRAIAVELARWEIPLVLVARDATKLAQLASDLEACYGVRCCVLEADLSKGNAAEKIHKATTEAGISVDILVNNAGVASEGLAINSKTAYVESMITLNTMSYAKLGVLYGRDMKKKRRGRILMMSSMAGLCHAAPNTAVYGACKAFGKSLALSMAKEMEPYGVGVTCLIPGAVSDTNFRESSGTRKALCWYLPFYSRSPDMVAHQGVVSLLDGDTQSIPGWQNRVFANIIRPVIPQRLEVMIVQLAFSPLKLPSLSDLLRRDKTSIESDTAERMATKDSPGASISRDGGSSWLSTKPRYTMQPPPRFLKLPEDEPQEEGRMHNLEPKNETFTKDEPSSSSAEIADGAFKGDVERDGKDIDPLDSSANLPDSSEEAENAGCMSETKLKAMDLSSRQPGLQHEEQTIDENGTKFNGIQTDKTPRAPGGKGYEYSEDKPSVPTNNDSEKIVEGKRIEKVRSPQWFQYYDEDEDDEFSTRLRPITRNDETTTMLPKQMNVNRRETNFVIV